MERHWLFWDEDCGFCAQSAAWLERWDGAHGEASRRFRTTPFQRAPSPPMTPELREACQEAVHILTADGRLLRAGRACLFAVDEIEALPWLGRLARVLRIPPLVWLVELGYRIVAANRMFFSRLLFPGEKATACNIGGAQPSSRDGSQSGSQHVSGDTPETPDPAAEPLLQPPPQRVPK